ncbi:hypothetical protein CHARACLAT_012382 [Characodon lateralis]|uniref:Uncharacterized protein n=1 Tax=Characodon lateralis TaxID=208331 RepID=A0ABU7DI57_9TELE|nr:hypothetical protein [Characodon lateralis]
MGISERRIFLENHLRAEGVLMGGRGGGRKRRGAEGRDRKLRSRPRLLGSHDPPRRLEPGSGITVTSALWRRMRDGQTIVTTQKQLVE